MGAKWIIHLIPYAVTGFCNFFESLKESQRRLFIFLIIGIIFGYGYWITVLEPKPSTLAFIDEAIILSPGETINNDWDLGYWIEYRGGKPSSKGGGLNEAPKAEGIAVSIYAIDCPIILENEKRKLYDCRKKNYV